MSFEKDIQEVKSMVEAGEKEVFKPATPEQIAARPRPPIEPDHFQWLAELQTIIHDYKEGSTDPLDGDEVDALAEILRNKLNYMEGNMTEDEYFAGGHVGIPR